MIRLLTLTSSFLIKIGYSGYGRNGGSAARPPSFVAGRRTGSFRSAVSHSPIGGFGASPPPPLAVGSTDRLAAVYAAARQAGIPRSLDEIEAVSRVERVPIMRTYRYVTRELNLMIPPSDPIDYVPRFASELEVSDDVEREACDLLETAIEEGYPSGKSPVGLAASVLYADALVANKRITQKRVQ